ncbi:MAG: molybdate ABC transporter substrate-binding protein, partial [Rhodoferax sp.]
MQPSFSKRFFAILILSLAVGSASAEELIVSAAASLTNAFKALGPVFEAQHPGTKV